MGLLSGECLLWILRKTIPFISKIVSSENAFFVHFPRGFFYEHLG